MIRRLAQIRSGKDAFLSALVITAAAVALAMTMTALATMDVPAERQLHAVADAAWISVVIGSIFSYWFVDSFRAMVQLKDTVDRLASTDDLTGLNNRRAFLASAEREISNGEGRNGGLALLILDLDYFKRINDTHGHRVGDLVLAAVGQVLSRTVGEGDVAGRLGGEEFAVLLMGCDEDAALRSAQSIRVAIEAMRVAAPAGPIGLTVSIGCTLIAAGEDVCAALQKADEALYAAKHEGRNRVALCARGGGSDLRGRAERQRRDPTPPAPLKRSA